MAEQALEIGGKVLHFDPADVESMSVRVSPDDIEDTTPPEAVWATYQVAPDAHIELTLRFKAGVKPTWAEKE